MRIFIFISFLVSVNIQILFACDCVNTTRENAFKKASVVIKGIVLTKKTFTRDVSDSYIDSFKLSRSELFFVDTKILEYEIRMEKMYKGNLTSDTLKLRTYLPSNCFLDISIGKTYIVYANRIAYMSNVYDRKISINTFESSVCSNTSEFIKQEDKHLDKLRRRK